MRGERVQRDGAKERERDWVTNKDIEEERDSQTDKERYS